MKQVLSDAGFVLALGVGYVGAAVVTVVIAVVYGWLWAIRVLAGNIKVGPKELWNDLVARRDLKARSTELKVAWAVLGSYLSALALAANMWVGPPSLQADTLSFTLRIGLLMVTFLALVCAITWLFLLGDSEWKRTARLLQGRLQRPVLF